MLSVRVFLSRQWRRLERGHRLNWCTLQLRPCRWAASTTNENEWALDLDDVDQEDSDHTPHEEPSPIQHRSSVAPGNRLLFNVGKRLMTATEFVRKANTLTRRSSVTLEREESVSGEMWESGEGVRRGGFQSVSGEMWESGEGVRRGGFQNASGEMWESGEGVRRGGFQSVSGEMWESGEGVRRGGFQSMRQTRKFLRGKGMAGIRLAMPPSETMAMVELLKTQLNLTAGSLEVFSTVPSVLGSEVREVGDRVRVLKRVGFTKREIETVLVSFPAILEVDYQNVYGVCGVLKRCIPGGFVLRGLLARHPFIFLLPVTQVEERVTVLKNVCRDPNSLGFLLHHFPVLLFTPLTPSTLHTITKFTSSQEGEGLGHSWVAKSLYHNLSAVPARLEPGPDIEALSELLSEFQLEPTPSFIKFPGFFKATYAHVAALIDVLTGSPLYLDTRGVRVILSSVPDQLVWTEDAEQLQCHVNQLCSLFPSAKECMEKVVSYPGLVLPQLGLSLWLDSLVSYGFTSQQIAALVCGTPNILLQEREEEFMPRIRLLLSLPEATPSQLVSCSITARVRMLSTPVDVLRTRLNYVERHKPELVTGENMEDIFASGDKDFASFCGRTPEQVRSGTGLKGMELRRFASSRKSPSTTPQTTKRYGKCGVYMTRSEAGIRMISPTLYPYSWLGPARLDMEVSEQVQHHKSTHHTLTNITTSPLTSNNKTESKTSQTKSSASPKRATKAAKSKKVLERSKQAGTSSPKQRERRKAGSKKKAENKSSAVTVGGSEGGRGGAGDGCEGAVSEETRVAKVLTGKFTTPSGAELLDTVATAGALKTAQGEDTEVV